MTEIIISCIIIILSFIFGINYGKKEKDNEVKQKQIENIRKSSNIDNTTDDTIVRMYDKYE